MSSDAGRGVPRRDLLKQIVGGFAGTALLGLVGCAAPAPEQSTPTPAPATATLVPPTATLLPPTLVPSPTSAPTPELATATASPEPTAVPATSTPQLAPSASPASTLPGASPTAGSSPTPGAQTVLRLATNHSAVEVPWFRKVLDTFAQDNPAYRVDQSNVTSLYLEQLSSWAAAGKLPDVVFAHSAQASACAYKRWIVSIDDLVTRDAMVLDVSDFHVPQIDELRLDGKWLLLPFDYSGQTLYSRADAYSDAGAAPSESWTWADLGAAARRATQSGSAGTTRWGFGWAADASALPGLWLAEAGTFQRDDGKGISVSSPDHVRITQWLADLALVDGSAPRAGEAGAGALVAGKLGAEVAGASAAAGYRSAGTRVLATALPKGVAGRRASYAVGSGWGLSRNAVDRDGAWKLLRHLSSRDSLEILVALPIRRLPGRVSAVPLWQAGLEAIGVPDHPDAIVRSASEGYSHRQAVWWVDYQDLFGELMPSVWSGARKAADVLPDLEKQVNSAAARYFA